MRFSRKMNHGVRLELMEACFNSSKIIDVDSIKTVTRIMCQHDSMAFVARIGQLVDVGDLPAFGANQMAHQSRPDESAPSSHQNSTVFDIAARHCFNLFATGFTHAQ